MRPAATALPWARLKALALVASLRATGVPPPLSCLVTDALDRPKWRSARRQNVLKATPRACGSRIRAGARPGLQVQRLLTSPSIFSRARSDMHSQQMLGASPTSRSDSLCAPVQGNRPQASWIRVAGGQLVAGSGTAERAEDFWAITADRSAAVGRHVTVAKSASCSIRVTSLVDQHLPGWSASGTPSTPRRPAGRSWWHLCARRGRRGTRRAAAPRRRR